MIGDISLPGTTSIREGRTGERDLLTRSKYPTHNLLYHIFLYMMSASFAPEIASK